jgi:hypothetical protein
VGRTTIQPAHRGGDLLACAGERARGEHAISSIGSARRERGWVTFADGPVSMGAQSLQLGGGSCSGHGIAKWIHFRLILKALTNR